MQNTFHDPTFLFKNVNMFYLVEVHCEIVIGVLVVSDATSH